ncbi:hypothetical protein MIR68_000068 [Amoeboaphelidium protococcarum]|nr:hypothetical protein MIR68_000068 [Amoeboaphelidium protococcarum]
MTTDEQTNAGQQLQDQASLKRSLEDGPSAATLAYTTRTILNLNDIEDEENDMDYREGLSSVVEQPEDVQTSQDLQDGQDDDEEDDNDDEEEDYDMMDEDLDPEEYANLVKEAEIDLNDLGTRSLRTGKRIPLSYESNLDEQRAVQSEQ